MEANLYSDGGVQDEDTIALNYQTEGLVEDRTISWEWMDCVKREKKAPGGEERKKN